MKKSLIGILGLLIFSASFAQNWSVEPTSRKEKISIESISPNPVQSDFVVQIDEQESFENLEVKVFNIIGKQLMSIKVENKSQIKIPFEEYAAGPYIISLHKKGLLQDSYRIIKK